jgi:hypothetical protein
MKEMAVDQFQFLFRPMDQLKLVEVGPGIAKVGVHFHRSLEPLSRFVSLTLSPHHACGCQENVLQMKNSI